MSLSSRKIVLVFVCSLVFIFIISVPNRRSANFYSIPASQNKISISQIPRPTNHFNRNASLTNRTILNTKYRINTRNCKISDLPLYDDETKDLFDVNNQTIWKCTKNVINIYRVNFTSILFNWTSLDKTPLCFYRKLSRGKDDFTYDYGKFIGPINQTVIDLPGFEFVHIVCYNNMTKAVSNKLDKIVNQYNKKEIIEQKDPDLVHDEIKPMVPFVNKTINPDDDVPNVILLAIDSTSYVNFKRHFTRTEKLLNKMKFFELRGYNKVGANTFPNMIPFLTGHQWNELGSYSDLKKSSFDKWPIIWKKFAQKGFTTAFVEESPDFGLFIYGNKKGFSTKPTDYYTRPFHKQIKIKHYNHYCYNEKTEFEHSLDWTLDMMRAMDKRQQKFFAYISICETTHDWASGGQIMDVPYFNFLSSVFEENLNKNTLILFFSDHGLRFGKLRETHSGEMENRLPFMFIHLPDHFNQTYEEHLNQNQHRLTTPFDIHASLTHLVDGKPDHSLPHGQSLFESTISEDRNCEKAAIPSMYCSCFEDIPVEDIQTIIPNQTIPKILKKINSYSEKFRSICAEYEFEAIKNIYMRNVSRTDKEDKLGNSQFYNVQMILKPGHALFEGMLRSYDNMSRFEVISDLTRISLYGNQSHCFHCDDCNEKFYRNYCYCKDLL